MGKPALSDNSQPIEDVIGEEEEAPKSDPSDRAVDEPQSEPPKSDTSDREVEEPQNEASSSDKVSEEKRDGDQNSDTVHPSHRSPITIYLNV
jgi:hypothetical protein